MSYPSLEDYNNALQNLSTSIIDPELKNGTIEKTGLGLPKTMCGGFALTYIVTYASKKYAVRCFHKKSNNLELRYQAISKRLKVLNSPYFLGFDFVANGIKINGNTYPLVKMEWAKGETLGEFLNDNYKKPFALQNLRNSLQSLAKYLEQNNIAHGDIQPGNLMVFNNGKNIQLIDYDGMYVDELRGLNKSEELGQRNFQHPKRADTIWNASLDRFSFILLDLAIFALEKDASLWDKTQSDYDAILFRTNDFLNPSQSFIFSELSKNTLIKEKINNLAAICLSTFSSIPSLDDFLANRNIPSANVQISALVSNANISQPPAYMALHDVMDATDYNGCLKKVGDIIELIGRVTEVSEQEKYGKRFVFINFGSWRGKIVKLIVWSNVLSKMKNKPTQKLVGKWISVKGLMNGPYINPNFNYSHLFIEIELGTNINIITEQEAKYRLISKKHSVVSGTNSTNQMILDKINKSNVAATSGNQTNNVTTSPISKNQAILQQVSSSKKVSQSSANTKSYQHKNTNVPSYKASNTLHGQHKQQSTKKNNFGAILAWIIFIIFLFAVLKK